MSRSPFPASPRVGPDELTAVEQAIVRALTSAIVRRLRVSENVSGPFRCEQKTVQAAR
jgi:hypothetical protein